VIDVLLEVISHVSNDRSDDLWGLYDTAFADLRTRAAQRHALTRSEFDEVMGDDRVMKHVVTDPRRGGRLCAVSTLTNSLDAVPLISPEYFEAQWPDLYGRNLIWYVGFLAVHPDYQGTGALARLIESMCATVPDSGGIIGADICDFNEATYRLPRAFAQLARVFTPGVTPRRLDAQTYWAYEFPATA
jgi:GNAT superfamily N-acetyltransferase